MKGIFSKELEEIEILIDRGKYDLALKKIDSISSQKAISEIEKIKGIILKSRVYSEISKYTEAIKLSEEAFEESKS